MSNWTERRFLRAGWTLAAAAALWGGRPGLAETPATGPASTAGGDSAPLQPGLDPDPVPTPPQFTAAVDEVCRLARLGLPDRAYLTSQRADHYREWLAASGQNDGSAWFLIAMCLAEGIGRPADLAGAAEKFGLAAKAGCTSGLVRLGAAYAAGAGVTADLATAVDLYHRAATAGDPDGMAALAIAYAAGTGVPQDATEAVWWFRAAANAGSPVGETGLSAAYRLGRGVPVDPAESTRHMRAAVDAGSALAMIAIADRYTRGDATLAADHRLAVVWARRAADLGSTEAMLRLADLAWSTVAAPLPTTEPSALPDAVDPATAAALREGVDWTRRAAAAGDPDAQLRLGDLCVVGLPPALPSDPAAALDVYRRSADGGNTTALARLGYAYQVGWHVAADPAFARSCYARGANDGDPECMAGLAATYARPIDDHDPIATLSHDPGTQFYWYQRAASAGLATGMLGLGSCYMNGVGTEPNPAEAAHWFSKAAEAGNGRAMADLGLLYSRGFGTGRNPTAAASWFREAALHGDGLGMRQLATAFATGHGVRIDGQRALALYELAIHTFQAQGERRSAAEVMRDVGQMYMLGQAVPRAVPMALTWLHRAADEGDPHAWANLATMSATGDGVPRDVDLALDCYRKAATGGDVGAMLTVGTLRQAGVGGPASDREAYEWYFKAASAGSAEAMDRVGALYEYGRRFPHHLPSAAYWYKQAAEAGNPMGAGHLSHMLSAGLGQAADIGRAISMARQAAAGGHPEFLTDVGDVLCRGTADVDRDVPRGAACLYEAARRGDRRAAAEFATLRPEDLRPTPPTTVPATTRPAAAAGDKGGSPLSSRNRPRP